jgi:hypothetical protein
MPVDDPTSPPDELSLYISALELADIAVLRSESDARSVNLEWFFENPDFNAWESSSSTEILLGANPRLRVVDSTDGSFKPSLIVEQS